MWDLTFRDYLKLAFENPDLAAGKIDRTSARFEAYTWFVGYFLWAVEEVLHFAKNDPVWLENVRPQMLAHRNYFGDDEEFRPRELPTYTPAVQALVALLADHFRTSSNLPDFCPAGWLRSARWEIH